ncbi:DUF2145 domain-containing protein [Undibacterium sp. Dicai25W]|uniref:DUF2145 domain-containing protein n=1 Tax=Undibacterium sp. Dicai25W TaxID=3413034 RepID=UPI003BEF7E8B
MHTKTVSLIFNCVLVALSLVYAPLSFAGRSCDAPAYDAYKVMQALELAQKTHIRLADSHADIAIIARVGQDLSKYHLRYSHLGIVKHDADGRWSVIHELNDCGTANSGLFDEGLGNFFLDDLFAFETLILIPNPELQAKIRNLLENGKAKALHDPHYNMLSYPFSTKYQNSNQWALEVLAAAQAQGININTREQAQAWLKSADYQADVLHIDTVTRLGARMFRANVSFDDHPFDRRMSGSIDTVTVESIVRFILMRDNGAQKIVLGL